MGQAMARRVEGGKAIRCGRKRTLGGYRRRCRGQGLRATRVLLRATDDHGKVYRPLPQRESMMFARDQGTHPPQWAGKSKAQA